MATKITVALEDDLEGAPAGETVRFGVGGTEYEIDLNKKNAKAFRKQLAPFVEHARRAGRGQRRLRTSSSRQRSGDIRAWARAQGIAISDRGRIPASVVEQYEAAARGSGQELIHRRPAQASPGQKVSGPDSQQRGTRSACDRR
jgi:nucleoid-associated protein Lsr2